jgi:hypothetical protein
MISRISNLLLGREFASSRTVHVVRTTSAMRMLIADGSNEDPHVNKYDNYRTLFPEGILIPLIIFFSAERKSINHVNWSNYAERY